MSRRRVLAISSDLDQLRRIVASLEQAGAEVDAVRSVEALTADVIPHRYVFAALGEDGAAGLDRLRPLLRDRAQVTVVADRAQLAELTACLRDARFNHVIVGDELDRGVYVTAHKLLTGDIFGIEKYLPTGTPVHYARLRDFAGRGRAIDTVLAFAEQAKMRRQVRSAIGQVCEELLMNALYDAPVDASGQQIFASVDPHDRTAVRSPRPVSIRFAATDNQFAVAVRDRFGRLAKNTILAYIDKCLHAPNQIDRKTYGAGLGLYLVANAAASYVVNVAYGIATEVVCTFDRGAKAPLRLVGVFVHPGGAEHLSHGPTPDTANADDGAPAAPGLGE
ncbi:MAG: hypothetical protein KBG28_11170 [Kofleriaceae bacterium]|nr:hypothetical protein [Kofleriaceae bacterium]MBP6838576.1 hypothetical protein [Kofleriaceae bacterium]MBP9204519.1 hypothetical protein [Kofleriaceae bacterium]